MSESELRVAADYLVAHPPGPERVAAWLRLLAKIEAEAAR